ncbi:MAG TPA: class I SAM-dependent methyltransferase, partial [Solirubrobacteraceae bacterium]|nr:class I SAM-dependent methyltransferase [Solirubrobacteraceae bacterium]
MGFAVAADSYDRFMGRYSVGLAAQLADLAGVAAGQRALDVGCGPGALTRELVARLGPDGVAAADPSEPFVAAARERNPGVDVRLAAAEQLPFDDGEFDAVLAQLVVHFMADAVAGLREMARVARPGGAVAACVWDHAGAQGPLGVFWQAVHSLDAAARDESDLAGAREGHLAELFAAAGLGDIEQTVHATRVEHPSFEEWWEPFTLGVGPAGAYARSLSEEDLGALRERCRQEFPDGAFPLPVVAWAARGIVAAR